jgi:hypothetical protein
VRNSQQAVLVVEGFLNSGGTTTIKLSKSFQLADTSRITMESGASVVVESRNAQYPLSESIGGNYVADLNFLDPSQEYRLHIKTSGKEYVSDYVKVQSTPAIDSINWTRDDKGVTVHANTHDPANNSLYYRYDFVETWEDRAAYIARWIYESGTGILRQRGPSEEVYQCWQTVPSTTIDLATSIALQNDIIHQKNLVFIPDGDRKLSVRYSILVKQYVLSKGAFNFFQLMKKNTESLGTIFDPQPTQLTGNIRSVSNPAEPVIGFFYGSSEQQKRIFINASEVPGWGFQQNCTSYTVPPDSVKSMMGGGLYPYDATEVPFVGITEVKLSETRCFDCTVRGGSKTKPAFW